MIAHYEPFSKEKKISGVIIAWVETEILREKHKDYKEEIGK